MRVAVICGGPSSERAVSLKSASNLAAALLRAGAQVLPVELGRTGLWRVGRWRRAPGATRDARGRWTTVERALRALRAADVVFPVVHGAVGEDGRLQGLLDVAGILYVGSGVCASALALDKARAKQLLHSATDLRMKPSICVGRDAARTTARALAAAARLRFPCVVKPVDGGSSLGVSIAASASELRRCLRKAFAVDATREVMVEERIDGDEVTCAVLENRAGAAALPPILIRPRHGTLFDYHAKYTPGASDEICPAPLPDVVCARVRRDALKAFSALGCRGLARVDFIVAGGEPWFLELNTMPGLTEQSLVPKAAAAAGLSLEELALGLVEAAARPAARAAAAARR